MDQRPLLQPRRLPVLVGRRQGLRGRPLALQIRLLRVRQHQDEHLGAGPGARLLVAPLRQHPRRGGPRLGEAALRQGRHAGQGPARGRRPAAQGRRPHPSQAPLSEAAVAVAGLRRDYGERTALDGVGFELAAGESLVVLGPNGAGKTTLLRILATLLRPSSGEVRVLGSRLPGEAWKLRGRVGFLGHEPLLYRDLSGRENLRFHARLHGVRGGRAEARIEALLAAIGMERRADQRVAELSAGMRQRLAVCRCVLHEPQLLLLDEPDSHLDAEGRELARALIGPGGSRTRVLVTHDPERALPDADQVLRLGIGGRAVTA
ncbi:MAG: heme ABC exporter ATP-binding protein CcmA [Solirubrobacterales bacterium]|nr:heme ABC exporter ATP-binding protein CcmA [Solirubrobacterales bacterium]